ncbi:MAG: TIGR03790 family protein [Planctomycetales bacterium]|nr:TIGR03790 family protein [Planctomycetales bacterium]
MPTPTRVLPLNPGVVLSLLAALAPTACCAALLPEEVAVVAAKGKRDSLALAQYYCRVRKVPTENICQIDVPSGEELEREHWRWAVRPEVRRWLEKNDPAKRIRCLVTVWGVPLKIKPAPADDKSREYLAHLQGERNVRLDQLAQLAKMLAELGAEQGPGGEGDTKQPDRQELAKQLESELQAAQQRISALEPEKRRPLEARLQQLASAVGGARVLLQGMAQQIQRLKAASQDVPAVLDQQFNALRGRASAFADLKLLLEQRAPGYERDAVALTSIQQNVGLLGAIEWLDEQIAIAQKNETGASFDSELSLVMWPEDYQLLRWQPNYLHRNYEGSQLPNTFRTLMVARLDAPTLKLAKGLIDAAIKVETQGGLKGKFYLDARGLAQLDGPPANPGSYEDYDRSLLATAEGMRKLSDSGRSPFDVVLDAKPDLFQPGDCPDAALYCGWYSLAKYVDAFDFVPGAVAYHLASAEATTLHQADSEVWCKRLLEDGVAATIGPVYEPYLLAYPRPNEFFAELVSGERTLAEAYWRTKMFNSWMMVLIGDPLYRPMGSTD